MASIFSAVATATVAFAATNIDDIFVLMLFFSQTNRGFRSAQIVFGQYLGFSVLVAISLVGFFGGRLLPQPWIGVLGVLPIIVGVRRWIRRNHPPVHVQISGTRSTAAVAGLTFANGGDNIGVYTPLFASSNAPSLLSTLLVFYLLLAVWCFLGYAITRHPAVGAAISRYGHLIVPFVLVALGIYIIAKSGTFGLLGF